MMQLARTSGLWALALMLSGCVAARAPMPLAESGPTAVELAGQSYLADLEPSDGEPTLSITRQPTPFGYADGAEAKRAAVTFYTNCKAAHPVSLGAFKDGAWIFKGGCR